MSTAASSLHASPADTCDLPPASALPPAAWRAELNARVREHRERRNVAEPSPAENAADAGSAAARVAERVAARYRDAPTYQELLAANAAAAELAAEAAFEAHAAAQAALSGWEQTQAHDAMAGDPFFTEPASPTPDAMVQDRLEDVPGLPLFAGAASRPLQPDPQASPAAPARVEHPVPLPVRQVVPDRSPVSARTRALVDAFAEAVVPAAQSLPAKLIEFPRELIASCRQRPRLAEGPLCEQESPGQSLRIFEVETELQTVADARSAASGKLDPGGMLEEEQERMPRRVEPRPEDRAPRRREAFHAGGEPSQAPLPGWGAIELGEHPRAESPALEPARRAARRAELGYSEDSAPVLEDQAPLTHRCMAALVDSGLVFACFLFSVLVFTSCTVHPPAGKAAVAAGLFALGVLAAFYGWLFMTYGGGSTPGMRYARVALCNFNDENPSRKELQNRIPATALALLPLGLGVLWALLDEDRLGWHDRMTRTYQRSYR